MTNKQKNKGTRFESAVVRYLRELSGNGRIERRALHGAQDVGDIGGIRCAAFTGNPVTGIAECKAHATVTPGLIERWRAETICERVNACADFAILIIKRPNKGTGAARVDVTVHGMLTATGEKDVADGLNSDTAALWVSLTLAEWCGAVWG